MKRPPADQSQLLERLVAGFEAEHDLEIAWNAVAEERDIEIESGRVQAMPIEEVLARLESRFPG